MTIKSNIIAVVMMCVVSVAFLYRSYQSDLNSDREKLAMQTVHEGNKILSDFSLVMQLRIEAIQRMASRWVSARGFEQPLWQQDAKAYMEHMPEFKTLQWVDADYIVRWVEPIEGNRIALEMDLSFESNRLVALETARQMQVPATSKPVELLQGGSGILFIFPLYVDSRFDGFLVAVLGFDKVATSSQVMQWNSSSNFDHRLFIGDSLLYSTGSEVEDSGYSKVLQGNLAGNDVRLVITPKQQLIEGLPSKITKINFIRNGLICVLLCAFVYIQIRRKNQSEEKAETMALMVEQIRQKDKAKQELKVQEEINTATLSSLLDAVIRIDSLGKILASNEATSGLFGYSEKELVGCNIRLLMPSVYAQQKELKLVGDYVEEETLLGVSRQLEGITRDKRMFAAQVTITEITVGSEKQFICVASDVTEKVEQQKRLEQLALYDSLTGCASRNLLRDKIDSSIARAFRHQLKFTLVYIDLDRFKPVNDKYGHKVGDLVLQQISSRLKSMVRGEDIVARIGGDEFVILLANTVDTQSYSRKLLDALSAPIEIANRPLTVSASIGFSVYPEDGTSQEQLTSVADERMYADKQKEIMEYISL